MQMADVNVLVYAHRRDAPEHAAAARLLRGLVDGGQPFAASEPVLAGFLRVVTLRNLSPSPTPLDAALEFVTELTSAPNCRLVRPGPRHLGILIDLCRRTGATGKLVADAAHAALAIEHGCEWLTADGDFARFPGLRWRHALRP